MGYASAAATSLNEEKLEKLLRHAKVTQQSIQTVSTWILDRRAFLSEIVAIWERLLHEGDAPHQIVYLYVANDTMQVGVRKYGKHISEVFETRLLAVVEYVMTRCDEKVKRCMIKIIGIWKERHTITPPLLEMLENVCAGKPAVEPKPVQEIVTVDDKARAIEQEVLKEMTSAQTQESVLADMTDVPESEATATMSRTLQDVVSATISADLLSDRMFQLESSLSTFHHATEAYGSGEGDASNRDGEDDPEEEKSAGDIVWEMLDQQVFDVDIERSIEHVHQYRANLEAQNAKRDELLSHLENLKLLDPFQEPIFHTSGLLRDQQTESLERLFSVCLKADLMEKERELERRSAYGARPPLVPTGSRDVDAYRVAVPAPQTSFSPHNDYYRSSEPVDSFQQAPPPRGLGHRRFSSVDGRDHFHRGEDHRYGGADDVGYNKRPKLTHSQSLDDTRRDRPSRWDQSPRGPDRNMPPFQEHDATGYGHGDRFQGDHQRGGYDRRTPSPRHYHNDSRGSRWDDQPRRW